MQFSIARFALHVAAIGMLAGCSYAQPPASTSLVSGPTLLRSDRGDLLYVAAHNNGYVLDYPSGKLFGRLDFTINGQKGISGGMCSDFFGTVFVTVTSASHLKIFKYYHSWVKPGAMLTDPQPAPVACAVNPVDNMLAVVNSFTTEGLRSVALFSQESGKPQIIEDLANVSTPAYCAYDRKGDLFVDGVDQHSNFALAELPKGSTEFESVAAAGVMTKHPGNLQRSGTDLTMAIPLSRKILTLRVTRSTATVVKTTPIEDWGVQWTPQTWLNYSTFIAPMGSDAERIGSWHYAKGGTPHLLDSFKSDAAISGLTISVLSS